MADKECGLLNFPSFGSYGDGQPGGGGAVKNLEGSTHSVGLES